MRPMCGVMLSYKGAGHTQHRSVAHVANGARMRAGAPFRSRSGRSGMITCCASRKRRTWGKRGDIDRVTWPLPAPGESQERMQCMHGSAGWEGEGAVLWGSRREWRDAKGGRWEEGGRYCGRYGASGLRRFTSVAQFSPWLCEAYTTSRISRTCPTREPGEQTTSDQSSLQKRNASLR